MNLAGFRRNIHEHGKTADTDTGNKTYSGTLTASGGTTLSGVNILSGGCNDTKVFEAHTAGDTLTAAESGTIHTNAGASGTIEIALPASARGLHYYFAVSEDAKALQIQPAEGETISLPSTGVTGTADKYITANAAEETVHLMCCSAGNWSVMGYTGTWTAEA